MESLLLSNENKVCDDDFPAVVKKKMRTKKPRHKFSMMHTIPVQALNLTEDSYGGRRGKRIGFSVYTDLTCKQCKPHRFFHKRDGLNFHSRTQHSTEWIPRYGLPIKSFNEPSTRSTRSSTRTVPSRSSTNEISHTKHVTVQDIELVELEDGDEIEVIDERCKETDNEIIPVVIDGSPSDKWLDNDFIECDEVVNVEDNRIKSFELGTYKWMESSPLYQPQILLKNILNLKMKAVEDVCSDVVDALTEKIEVVDANDIIVLDDMIDLEGSPVKRSSSHIGKLFEEEGSLPCKRTVNKESTSPCKRRKAEDEVELLMVEEDDDARDKKDLMDIQSMLEVTMEEEFTGLETESVVGEFDEREIIEVDLEPEEDTEVFLIAEQDNIVFDTLKDLESNDLIVDNSVTRKLKSINDLVMQWANEEESLISKTSEVGKMKSMKRKKDLKLNPYKSNGNLNL